MAVPPPPGRVVTAPREEPATLAGFIDATRMCITVVSPQFEVRAGLLPTSGWSWFQPRQVPMGNRTFEMVQYSKGGISLVLLDGGSLIVCRVVGEVEDPAQLSEVRGTLIQAFGAAPVESVPRLTPLVDRIRRGAPQTVLANFLVAGDYSFEITLQQRTLPASSAAPARTYRAIMVESVPLPAAFRAAAGTGAQ